MQLIKIQLAGIEAGMLVEIRKLISISARVIETTFNSF
jgi:hypothetical protein